MVHAHAEDVLPFGLVKTPLQPVIHSGSFIGGKVPVWDIAKKFGDTNLLVTNMAQGRDLAKCLGKGNVALMRGHGFASAARSIIEVVRLSVYLPRNARVQLAAMQLGKPMKLSKGEIAARAAGYKPHTPETWRAWEYWGNRAGCGDMIGEPHAHAPGPERSRSARASTLLARHRRHDLVVGIGLGHDFQVDRDHFGSLNVGAAELAVRRIHFVDSFQRSFQHARIGIAEALLGDLQHRRRGLSAMNCRDSTSASNNDFAS